MNYRHAFHAGNFADLVKHAMTLAALRRLQAEAAQLRVVDTHAGAGRYEINPLAPGEAIAVQRLLADAHAPAVFDALKAAVAAESAAGSLVYPGSPLLVARALRPADRLLACELQAQQHAALRAVLEPFGPRVEAALADGYAQAPRRLGQGRALLLIDPPFERGDDYEQTAAAVGAALETGARTTILIWAPLKDLETLDRLVRSLEALGPAGGFTAEVRLRPPLDPMRLNGCAVVALNPPEGLADEARVACEWIAETLGEPGGRGRVWPLQPQA